MRRLIQICLLLIIKQNLYAQFRIINTDPLSKILPLQSSVIPFSKKLAYAKSETALFQLVIQSNKDITDLKCNIFKHLPGSTPNQESVWYQHFVFDNSTFDVTIPDKLISENALYPDALTDTIPAILEHGINHVLLVEVPINSLQQPGSFPIGISLTGKTDNQPFYKQHIVTLEVLNVGLSPSTYYYTNWYHDVNYQLLNGGATCKPFSKLYYEIFTRLVQTCVKYKQNVFAVNPMFLIQFKRKANIFSFDFKEFDNHVNIILKAGCALVEGRQFGNRKDTWESEFYVQVPQFYNRDSAYYMKLAAQGEPESKRFYNRLLDTLYTHLIAKGWINKYYQHLMDEPIVSNQESYKKFSTWVSNTYPRLKTIDALGTPTLKSFVDVPVFALQDIPLYIDTAVLKPNKEWFYTARLPQGNYVNRFIQQPLLKNRLLPWIAFRYNLAGYLHWGLNFWPEKGLPTSAFNKQFPSGDAYIIYPAYRKVLPSLRLLAIRDGWNDFSLLQMLEKKDKAKARVLLRKIILAPDRYQTDNTFFYEIRRQLLLMLQPTSS